MDLINILRCTIGGVSGGDDLVRIASITGTIVDVIKIGVPILLIIFGMMDLGKAVIAQKDDEIKKGQKTFMTRCIAAAIVFFIVTVVQLLVGILATDDEKSTISGCISCFISDTNDC